MHQLLHDLVVDVLPDLAEMAQIEEEAAADTLDMLVECQLDFCEHAKVMYDS